MRVKEIQTEQEKLFSEEISLGTELLYGLSVSDVRILYIRNVHEG